MKPANKVPIEEKFFEVRFVVSGAGPFPIDMLRQDRCSPVSEADSQAITRSFEKGAGPLTINLRRFTHAGRAGPREVLWNALGWSVSKVEYQVDAFPGTLG